MDEQNKEQEGGSMDEMNGSESVEMGGEEKSMGGAVGAVIIVAILIIGGVYFINRDGGDAVVAPAEVELTAEEITALPDEATEALGTQGTSDAVADIETDLSLDLGNLEEGLGNIDAELAL